MLTIKEMVSGGKKVKFQFYRAKELWYVTEDGFEFPVPVADCGDGVFLNEDKAILFMRYIRKHLESIEAGRLLQESKDAKEFAEKEIEQMLRAVDPTAEIDVTVKLAQL